YKFSWSPMGVLTASQNSATFLRDGSVVSIDGPELLNNADPIYSFPTMNLECLANRDSLIYRELYGIEDADSVFRGTLRFAGFSDLMYGVKTLGLLDDAPCAGGTWGEVLDALLAEHGASSMRDFCEKKGIRAGGGKLEHLFGWLEMLDRSKGLEVADPSSIVKSLCALLETRLTLEDGERDMVLMAHDIVGEFPGGKEEVWSSTMQLYGDERFTAMGKTVGVTAAIGAEMVLDGWIKEKGVLTPMTKNIYEKGLELLEQEGLVFQESCTVVEKK
ncbi:hypothetical protein TeGR_g12644, partial [Tetraparma gracilis]